MAAGSVAQILFVPTLSVNNLEIPGSIYKNVLMKPIYFLEPASGSKRGEIRPVIDRTVVHRISYNMHGHALRRFTLVRIY